MRPEPTVLRISNDDAVCACAPVPHRLVLRDALPRRQRRVGWQLQTAKQTTCAVSACPCRCAGPPCVHRSGLLPTPRIRTAFRRDRGLSLVSTIAPRKALSAAQGAFSIFRWGDCTSAAPIRQTFFENRLVHNKMISRPTLCPSPANTRPCAPARPIRSPTLPRSLLHTRFFLQKVFASAADLFISPPTTPTGFAPTAALGNRLTVDPRTLTPLVLVRIQVPQPNSSFIRKLSSIRFPSASAWSIARLFGRGVTFGLPDASCRERASPSDCINDVRLLFVRASSGVDRCCVQTVL